MDRYIKKEGEELSKCSELGIKGCGRWEIDKDDLRLFAVTGKYDGLLEHMPCNWGAACFAPHSCALEHAQRAVAADVNFV